VRGVAERRPPLEQNDGAGRIFEAVTCFEAVDGYASMAYSICMRMASNAYRRYR